VSAVAQCEDWPARLEKCVAGCDNFHRVTVLRETESTQDVAALLHAKPGDVITAFRQTAGRGRLGRIWADTESEGVAVTLVTPAAPAERLAMLSAVATARAAEHCSASIHNAVRVGIRWPNDIVIDSRKLAGILIEQDRNTARIGIGMNVAQRMFTPELSARACSLAQHGITIDRAAVVAAIISCMDAALGELDESLHREFADRDVLRGCVATFEHDRRTITGRVLDVDPMRGLRVLTGAVEVFLPAHTTSLLSVE
jgi:BirA family biotin operon repressor/biotin-[acetyl-CoA-carboxylase] ligase